MTSPTNSNDETGTLSTEGPVSRRELRRRRLIEEAAAGIITPKSIFDLEYIPRVRAPIPPEPAQADDRDAIEAAVAEDLVAANAEVGELETTIPLETAPDVLPEPEPEPEPETVTVPELVLAQPVQAPVVLSKKPKKSVDNALLFQRIPEPAQPAADEAELRAATEPESDEPSVQPRSRRKKIGTIAAMTAVFGFVLTLTLPAVDNASEAAVTEGDTQELVSYSSTDSIIDIESFESVDELEVAAEAATLRANTFTNDPTAAVQYPFDVGVPITDGFGPRSFPVSGFHDAQDFAAGYGAAVRAIANGTVIESGTTTDGCGFGLKIKHRIEGHNVESRYCHLAADPVVAVGDKVKVGQFVALVGATGIAYGAHLHMVIEWDGEAIDPMPFFAKYNKPKPIATSGSKSSSSTKN